MSYFLLQLLRLYFIHTTNTMRWRLRQSNFYKSIINTQIQCTFVLLQPILWNYYFSMIMHQHITLWRCVLSYFKIFPSKNITLLSCDSFITKHSSKVPSLPPLNQILLFLASATISAYFIISFFSAMFWILSLMDPRQHLLLFPTKLHLLENDEVSFIRGEFVFFYSWIYFFQSNIFSW